MSSVLLRIVVLIIGLLVLVAVAVGAIERRQDRRRDGRSPEWRYALVGARRPAPLRIQLVMFVVIVAAPIAVVLAS